MKILIIHTADGYVYYRGDRNASVSKAVDFAASVAIRQEYGCRYAVQKLIDNHDYRGLEKYLREVGMINEAEVRE